MKKALLIMMALLATMVLLVACGDDDEEIEAGAEGGACLEDGTCNEGLMCNEEDVCVAEAADGDDPDGDDPDGDDPDGDEPECVEDADCLGISICGDDEGEAFCSLEVADVCMDGDFNQDCPGTYEMNTVKYGACAEIACESDDDCDGLETCDDPDKPARTASCDTAEGLCMLSID